MSTNASSSLLSIQLIVWQPGPAVLGKGPWPKLGKIIDLTTKWGEINDIEQNKGTKIYPQNQVFFIVCQPYHLSTSVKFYSDMGHCFS